jgi:uncharacterized protein Veg
MLFVCAAMRDERGLAVQLDPEEGRRRRRRREGRR